MADDIVATEMGRRLKQCRKLADWTQERLSRETGWVPDVPDGDQPAALSPSRIGNFEQGKRRIGLEEAKILERVFRIPAGYFLFELDTRESAVVAALRGLRSVIPYDDTGS
jgi:transcriptional regulator with XRE-family HTH domain